MAQILDILPDGKGGQLKFRIDLMECQTPVEDSVRPGEKLDIYVVGQRVVGVSREVKFETINWFNINHGRPKGYGIALWDDQNLTRVLWTPFIGDEGYIPEDEV